MSKKRAKQNHGEPGTKHNSPIKDLGINSLRTPKRYHAVQNSLPRRGGDTKRHQHHKICPQNEQNDLPRRGGGTMESPIIDTNGKIRRKTELKRTISANSTSRIAKTGYMESTYATITKLRHRLIVKLNTFAP